MEDELVVDPEYMTGQNDINERMRSILVDWLISVHWSFQFSPETLCLAVRIIDCHLNTAKESRGQLQLVGAAALLVASERVEIFPANSSELVYLCDGAYTAEQIAGMADTLRTAILKRLSDYRTSYSYLVEFLQEVSPPDRRISHLAQYILEGTLLNLSLVKYSSSQLAAASLWIAHCSLGTIRPTRNTTVGGHKREELQSVAHSVLNARVETFVPETRNRALQNKYSCTNYFREGLVDIALRND